jgi:lysophospholipase L1-like esterase
MPLGDSITEGTGYAGGYRGFLYTTAVADNKNITFVGSLTSNPPTGITGFPRNHEGHFAWTIQQIDDIVPTPTLNVSPHIILLHIGTNDVNQKLSGAPTRLKSLVDQIVTTLPDSLLAVAKIIPVSGATSAVEAYNAEIPAIVQAQASSGKHVILVDQYTGFPTSELGDGVHPNQAGYTRMAGVWYTAIKSYLH